MKNRDPKRSQTRFKICRFCKDFLLFLYPFLGGDNIPEEVGEIPFVYHKFHGFCDESYIYKIERDFAIFLLENWFDAFLIFLKFWLCF